MPPGFGLLDTALVSVPVFLLLLGLIRGAPVELASCCGCLAGVAAAWAASCVGPVQALGQPVAPLLALLAGIVAWRIARGLSKRFGFDERWINLGRLFDCFVGGLMGAVRGVAMVSAGCVAYAVVAVPLGVPNPLRTAAYPVFLALGSQVTSAAIEAAEPMAAKLAEATGGSAPAQDLSMVPLPLTAPQLPVQAANPAPPTVPPMAPVALPTMSTPNGPALAALLHVIAPSAEAAPARVPMPAYRPDIPVRGIPVNLLETHHNILHPFGVSVLRRRPPHR